MAKVGSSMKPGRVTILSQPMVGSLVKDRLNSFRFVQLSMAAGHPGLQPTMRIVLIKVRLDLGPNQEADHAQIQNQNMVVVTVLQMGMELELNPQWFAHQVILYTKIKITVSDS